MPLAKVKLSDKTELVKEISIKIKLDKNLSSAETGYTLELITFEILAAERLRLMAFDNRLIIDCFANVANILIWQFSTNDRLKSLKYESITWKIHFQK